MSRKPNGHAEADLKPDVLKTPIIDVSAVPNQAPDRMPKSGMTGAEAVARAAQWWDSVGAPIARKQLVGNKDPINQDIVVASGVLCGLDWEQLNKRERFRIVKSWHDTFVAQMRMKLVDDRKLDPKLRRVVTKQVSKDKQKLI